ncbi:MAG: phenylalanine--tRNA ligase subunit beta [Lachnospiraceae bacterium]|nr:phenylalanine--tRNA ligase subunit beta [Lachnospiraceae bacterium]
MFVSMNWIKDFVDLEGEDIDKLIHRFTLSTAEVEGVDYKGRDITGVVVGEILECAEHPDSDHLHLLKVDDGSQVYDVVCGAPNARAGIKTAFARLGASLGEIKIKPAKLRGQVSNGMCCSAKELGISDDHSGIMELDPTLVNGTDLKEIFPIDDIIFEVDNKSLTNRPDLWGHYGMAREFAAMVGKPLKELPLTEDPYMGDETVDIEVRNMDFCYRYTGVRMENITEKQSPMYMQIRLFYCGMRAINLPTDLTNYIMLELGQPTHAFDGKKISKIVVDTPKTELKFTTLDGNERDITTDTLMIYDNDTPVAIAGIMGGLDSEIEGDTDSVVLECANFDGVSVRKSASRLALRTDASARYEKTLDPEMTMLAAKRFINLISGIDPGARCVSKISDVYVKHYETITVDFDKAFIDRYTGIDISCDRIEQTLKALGFTVKRDGDDFSVTVPSFRATKDISMKADIVEEITRIYGYDNFEIKTALSPIMPAGTSLRRSEENSIKDLLVKTYAMHEVHTRIWADPDELRDLSLTPEDNVMLLQGSKEQATGILRTSMFESFLPVIYQNRNYAPTFSIFEIGRTIHGVRDDETADERRALAIGMYSKELSEKNLYFKAVELINTMISELKHEKVTYKKTETSHVWQHPKNTSLISVAGTDIGVINTLHPTTLKKISKNGYVVCIEIDMDRLLSVKPKEFEFDEPSKFPGIDYDISVLIPEGIRFEQIENEIRSVNAESLKDLKIIDIYDADAVKSITIRLCFSLSDRTLTGEEVQEVVDKILEKLAKLDIRLKS